MGTGRHVEIGLVLQGGGALGAYEWGAITALLDLMDEMESRGDTVVLTGVSGVSIGAVNAACLVGSRDRDDARDRLTRLWEFLRLETGPLVPATVQRDLSLFGLPGFYRPRTDYWNMFAWTSIYTTTPLLGTLRDHVDFVALNKSETALIVTAVDVETGQLVRFRNPAGTGPAPDSAAAMEIEPRHVLASGSLAPQFPWVELGRSHYWDGGLVDNAPLGDVIDTFSAGPQVERMIVVMNLYPLRARLPGNLAEVQDRVHELSFGNRVRQDQRTAERVNALVSTIDALAELVAENSMSDELRAAVERARLYKVVTVVEIDMQNPSGSTHSAAEQMEIDDSEGLRDFSARTVELRRAAGYDIATDTLARHLRTP